MAAEAASMAYLDQEFEEIRNRLRQNEHLPAEWHDPAGTEGVIAFLTADELAELKGEMQKALLKYDDRRTDPSLRPDGARAVRFFLATTIAPE